MTPAPGRGIDDLQELLWSFAGHRVLTVAGRVGLLRRLADGAERPEEAAAALGLDAGPCGKIVRALNALGLTRCEDGRYRLTDELAPLFREGPDDIGPFLEHSHEMYERWGENLEPWLRGESWTTAPRSEEAQARFAAAMRAMGTRLARELAAAYDLSGVRTLLDVGGSVGHYAEALARAKPDLEATVLDVEKVARLGEQRLAGGDLASRIRFVGGDYLDPPLPGGFDLVLLANVVHQESRARAPRLIRAAAEQTAPGGRVAILDFSIDADRHRSVVGALFAINMRSFGDTWDEPTLRGWLADAGLGDVTRLDLNPHRWVISGRRPG